MASSGYTDLFGKPALKKKSEVEGSDVDGDGGHAPYFDKMPAFLLYKLRLVLRRKASPRVLRESDKTLLESFKSFKAGQLSLPEARGWIEGFERRACELPEVYRSTAPQRYTEDSPPPPKEELNALGGSKADRAARRIQKEMEGMKPLERLEHAAFVQQHRRWKEMCPSDLGAFMMGERTFIWRYPLSDEHVARIQREAVEHVYDRIRHTNIIGTFDGISVTHSQSLKKADLMPPAKQLQLVNEVLLKLDMMDDFGGIVEGVREKMLRLKEYVESRLETEHLEAEQDDQREQAAPSEVGGDGLPQNEAPVEDEPGTPGRWQHLARATMILERHPDLKKKEDFLAAARQMKDELGLGDKDGPGGAIWKGVQRLAKDVLEETHLPDHYGGMEGFHRLANDLRAGTATAQPGERQQDS